MSPKTAVVFAMLGCLLCQADQSCEDQDCDSVGMLQVDVKNHDEITLQKEVEQLKAENRGHAIAGRIEKEVKKHEHKEHEFRSTAGKYQYYRMDVTENAGGDWWCVQELSFFDADNQRLTGSHIYFAGTAQAQTNFANAYAAGNAFNEDDGYYCSARGTKTGWLQYRFPFGPTSVAMYKVKRLNAYGNQYSPVAWRLMGSNDDNTWITLDSQAAHSSWDAGEIKEFKLADTPPGPTCHGVDCGWQRLPQSCGYHTTCGKKARKCYPFGPVGMNYEACSECNSHCTHCLEWPGNSQQSIWDCQGGKAAGCRNNYWPTGHQFYMCKTVGDRIKAGKP